MSTPQVHPLLGTGPEWRVTNFPATVEFDHQDGRHGGFPKPLQPMPPEWWREQAAKAIREATHKPKVYLR